MTKLSVPYVFKPAVEEVVSLQSVSVPVFIQIIFPISIYCVEIKHTCICGLSCFVLFLFLHNISFCKGSFCYT